MSQQTAVEWLRDELFKAGSGTPAAYSLLFEQAKQMEKKQIINAHNSGVITPYTNLYTIPTQAQGKQLITKGEQYYNETYGNNQK